MTFLMAPRLARLGLLARPLLGRRLPSLRTALSTHRQTLSSLVRHPHLEVSRRTSWGALPTDERAAWSALGWSAESWDGSRHAPMSTLQNWDELTASQRGAAQHGLGYTEELWNAQRDASAIVLTSPSDDAKPPARLPSGGGASVVGTFARAAWGVAKTVAPVAGSALAKARHPGFMLAGHVLQSVPSVLDAVASPVDVCGIETVLYLDDSGSMRGSVSSSSGSGSGSGGSSSSGGSGWGGSWGSTLLDEGKRVLSTMGPLLRGPTRVLKFGAAPTVHCSSRRLQWPLMTSDCIPRQVLAPRVESPPMTSDDL